MCFFKRVLSPFRASVDTALSELTMGIKARSQSQSDTEAPPAKLKPTKKLQTKKLKLLTYSYLLRKKLTNLNMQQKGLNTLSRFFISRMLILTRSSQMLILTLICQMLILTKMILTKMKKTK